MISFICTHVWADPKLGLWGKSRTANENIMIRHFPKKLVAHMSSRHKIWAATQGPEYDSYLLPTSGQKMALARRRPTYPVSYARWRLRGSNPAVSGWSTAIRHGGHIHPSCPYQLHCHQRHPSAHTAPHHTLLLASYPPFMMAQS